MKQMPNINFRAMFVLKRNLMSRSPVEGKKPEQSNDYRLCRDCLALCRPDRSFCGCDRCLNFEKQDN